MKSKVVSWIGVVMSIVQLLVKKVDDLGGDDEDIRCLAKPDFEDLVGEFAEMLMKRRRTWSRMVKKAYSLMNMETEYAEFLKKFGTKEIPGRWAVPMIKGISYAKIIKALIEASSNFWSYYNDLDVKVSHNNRDANRDGSYQVSFLATVEADQENIGKSFNKLQAENHQSITLMERLFLELVYFLMTSDEYVKMAVDTINHKPRKSLGYKTSLEVMEEHHLFINIEATKNTQTGANINSLIGERKYAFQG